MEVQQTNKMYNEIKDITHTSLRVKRKFIKIDNYFFMSIVVGKVVKAIADTLSQIYYIKYQNNYQDAIKFGLSTLHASSCAFCTKVTDCQ